MLRFVRWELNSDNEWVNLVDVKRPPCIVLQIPNWDVGEWSGSLLLLPLVGFCRLFDGAAWETIITKSAVHSALSTIRLRKGDHTDVLL